MLCVVIDHSNGIIAMSCDLAISANSELDFLGFNITVRCCDFLQRIFTGDKTVDFLGLVLYGFPFLDNNVLGIDNLHCRAADFLAGDICLSYSNCVHMVIRHDNDTVFKRIAGYGAILIHSKFDI